MNTLVAENIVKKYSNHLALDHVSIEVPKGSVFGLLGPNGAGKTTLIRIINQITAPDTGQVLFNGERLSQKHISRIGYLPEERGLYKKMTVGEQSMYLCQLKGMSKKDALLGLKHWFEKFEIQAWWNKKVEELSKGMAQKLQFITTVLHKPELLIFDEPFSGFDPINANLLKNEILQLRDEGATIIFSTHNMASVEEVCDHIALINKSKKIIDGDINSVRTNFASEIYDIEFNGFFSKLETTLTSDYKILHANESPNGGYLQVEVLNSNMKSNDLLNKMISFGTISSFKKHIPSMNDIFIKAVEETNSKPE